VMKSGVGPPVRIDSVNGQVGADNARASLQALVVSPGDGFDPAKLQFRLFCIFVRNNNHLPDQALVQMGEWCPHGGAGESAFLQAFRIELLGPDEGKYLFSYQCKSYLSNATQIKPFGWMGAGGLCGETSNQPVAWWISALDIKLAPR
jgi:hypothetical protein